MAHAGGSRSGGLATARRLCALVVLLPFALSLSAAERRTAAPAEDLSLQRAYAAAVQARVLEHWLRPPSVQPGQRCATRILQLPTGTVISVEAQPDCQFDAAGRASIEAAVRRAQPLPTKGFESVYRRELRLTFVGQ